jgi:hypothetical protein
MGARGILAAYASYQRGPDVDAVREKYVGDDLKYVTRRGTFPEQG